MPQETRLVAKKLILQGMGLAQVFDLLKRENADMALLINLAAHSRDQEFEADRIGGYLIREAGISVEPILQFMEARAMEEKTAGKDPPMLGRYPSFSERSARLKVLLAE